MKQDPPNGATLGVGKPWSLWKAYALPEVVDALSITAYVRSLAYSYSQSTASRLSSSEKTKLAV